MDTQASYSVIGDGTAKCATPATAVQVASTSTPCRMVEVTAFQENTGLIVIGASTVVATAGSRRGRHLAPGETATFHVKDVNLLYMDALTAGDGLGYVYYKTTT